MRTDPHLLEWSGLIFRFPFVYVFLFPLAVPGAPLTKIGLVSAANQGRECNQGVWSSQSGKGACQASPLPAAEVLIPGLKFSFPWAFSFPLSALHVVLLVVPSSDYHLGVCFPSLTYLTLESVLLKYSFWGLLAFGGLICLLCGKLICELQMLNACQQLPSSCCDNGKMFPDIA